MENKIQNGDAALQCAENIRQIGTKWSNVILPEIKAALAILNEGVSAEIQVAFNDVITNNEKAFEFVKEILKSLPETVEAAVEDIRSVDATLANKIREKYGV